MAMSMPDRSSLILSAIEKNVRAVRTRSLDLSFNELLDMYEAGELIIDPEYQRAFRWSPAKESRFIESLLLGMPIPPIFVIELSDGKYELIDGLQRLSSYFHFRGKLYAETPTQVINKGECLELTDCDIVAELNGLRHEQLPTAMAIRLKRHFVRVEVIGRDSDERLRYHMFKRLNTGGENLSDQEIRNCTVRLLNDKFIHFIASLSTNPAFVECIQNISDESKEKKFDQELVLRFLAFKNNRVAYRHDVGDFMTEYMEAVADSSNTGLRFDYEKEEAIFTKTFHVLSSALQDRVFGWANKAGNIVRGFSVYHYEAITLGIQACLDRIDPENVEVLARVTDALEAIKRDRAFIAITSGGGRNSRGALDARVGFVTDRLQRVV